MARKATLSLYFVLSCRPVGEITATDFCNSKADCQPPVSSYPLAGRSIAKFLKRKTAAVTIATPVIDAGAAQKGTIFLITVFSIAAANSNTTAGIKQHQVLMGVYFKTTRQPVIDTQIAATAGKKQAQQHHKVGRGKLNAVVQNHKRTAPG